jgi:hypothetical protein
MVRKVLFALLMTLQFSVVADLASAYSPSPTCYPCPDAK